ncbi:hypothetical protein GCM10022270_21380 [Terriglobus aquaticus]
MEAMDRPRCSDKVRSETVPVLPPAAGAASRAGLFMGFGSILTVRNGFIRAEIGGVA